MKKIKYFKAFIGVILTLPILTSCGLVPLPNMPGGHDKPSKPDISLPSDNTSVHTSQENTETYPMSSETEVPHQPSYPDHIDPAGDDTILKDRNCHGYAVLCDGVNSINGVRMQSWGYFDGTSVGAMEPTSFKRIHDIDKQLAYLLADKYEVEALYMCQGIEIAKDMISTWNFEYGPNATSINGCYAIKCGTTMYDEENDRYAISTWIQSPESGRVISLTPDTYWVSPNYQEEKDEHGYDWNTNPAVTAGAGEYTMVVAKFRKTVSVAPSYGIGMIKTKSWPEFKPAELDRWKLTGNFTRFGQDNFWTTDSHNEHLLFSKAGSIRTKLFVGDEFKITKILTDGSGTWEGALDASDVDLDLPCQEYVDVKSNENIKIIKDGLFEIFVNKSAGNYRVYIQVEF